MQTIGGDAIELSAPERSKLEAERLSAAQSACAQGATWSVAQWMDYLNHINPEHMELGLERVREVAIRMGLMAVLKVDKTTIVTVAGTNGKGSTATLIARAMGQFMPVGLFTSPHLLKFNERIEVKGEPIGDEALVDALHQVVKAQFALRANSSPLAGQVIFLTYFEIVTLAAMFAFLLARCPLIVLEVGLGGRLDSTNIFDAAVAVITSIGLDHMKVLGHTTTAIAGEKAGIIKHGSTVILGENIDAAARQVILAQAAKQEAQVLAEGTDFSAEIGAENLRFKGPQGNLTLSLPQVPFGCVGPALAAISTLFTLPELSVRLPQFQQARNEIDAAVAMTKLLGRMTKAPQVKNLYLDVAHNVPAAEHLVTHELPEHLGRVRPWLVIGMLKDKDVEGVLEALAPYFERFYVGSLHTERGESSARLRAALLEYEVAPEDIVAGDSIAEVLALALDERYDETIVVVGSFVTVSEAWQYLSTLV